MQTSGIRPWKLLVKATLQAIPKSSSQFFAKFCQCGSQANFKQIGSTNHLVNQTRAEASLEKSNNVFCAEKINSRFSHWLSHLNHTHSCQKLLIDWNMARWIISWIQQPHEVTTLPHVYLNLRIWNAVCQLSFDPITISMYRVTTT